MRIEIAALVGIPEPQTTALVFARCMAPCMLVHVHGQLFPFACCAESHSLKVRVDPFEGLCI
jgi:hypothetical protein